MELQPEEFTNELHLANIDHWKPLVSTHDLVPSKRNRRGRRQRTSRLRSIESLLSVYQTNADPWKLNQISSQRLLPHLS